MKAVKETKITVSEIAYRVHKLEELYGAIYNYYSMPETSKIVIETRKRENATIYIIPPEEAEMLLEYIMYYLQKPAGTVIPSPKSIARTIMQVFLERKTPNALLFEDERREIKVSPGYVPIIVYREYCLTHWRIEALEIPPVRICLVC